MKGGSPRHHPFPGSREGTYAPRSFSAHLQPGLEEWKQLNTLPALKEGETLVHVRVPWGNLKRKDLEAIAWIMKNTRLPSSVSPRTGTLFHRLPDRRPPGSLR